MRKRRRLVVLAAASLAVLVAALTPAAAGAVQQNCNFDTGEWSSDGSPGEDNRVVAGFDAPNNRVVATQAYRDQTGDRRDDSITCSSDETTWRLFESHLGDRDDLARTDGEGFNPSFADPEDFGPVPGRIRVRLFGERGDDRLLGHAGPDRLEGGIGSDLARGFTGPDKIVGGPGQDRLEGRADRDEIDAADGAKDTVRCGPDEDTALVDPVDRVSGCENTTLR